MSTSRGIKIAGVATGLAIVVVASTAGIAGIPSSSGQIDACFAVRGGALRVIDTEAGQTCASREKPLSWSSQPGEGPMAYGLIQWAVDSAGNPSADVDESRSVGLTDQMVRLWKSTDGNNSYEFCFDVPFEVDNVSVTAGQRGVFMAARLGGCGDGGLDDFNVIAASPSTFAGQLAPFFIVLR